MNVRMKDELVRFVKEGLDKTNQEHFPNDLVECIQFVQSHPDCGTEAVRRNSILLLKVMDLTNQYRENLNDVADVEQFVRQTLTHVIDCTYVMLETLSAIKLKEIADQLVVAGMPSDEIAKFIMVATAVKASLGIISAPAAKALLQDAAEAMVTAGRINEVIAGLHENDFVEMRNKLINSLDNNLFNNPALDAGRKEAEDEIRNAVKSYKDEHGLNVAAQAQAPQSLAKSNDSLFAGSRKRKREEDQQQERHRMETRSMRRA